MMQRTLMLVVALGLAMVGGGARGDEAAPAATAPVSVNDCLKVPPGEPRLACMQAVRERREQGLSGSGMQAVLSVRLCSALQDRRDAQVEIAKERKLARAGGVVDLEERKRLRDQLEEAEARADAARVELRRARKAPLSCSSKAVTALWDCWSTPGDERCKAEPLATQVQAVGG
jgi:hypothetical protein